MNERATTQSAAAPDEMEAALANMDRPLAKLLENIRLRMQGLSPGDDPEPKQDEKAEEAATPVIAIEAVRWPDSGIGVKASPRQEDMREAAIAVKPSGDAVAAALKPLEARARRLSPVKRRMIESSVKIGATLPDDMVFQHSVFCQTVLPYRDPGSEVRIWERTQGQVYLSLEAGRVKDPQGRFVPVGLPYGPAARLILCHLNTEALRTGNPAVDTGDSLTAFVRRLKGFDPNGREIRRVKEQLIRTAAALVRLAVAREGRTVQVDTKIIIAFDVWEESFEGERFLFPGEITLSANYFESLQAHAVPLDERAVAALAHSAMGLDIYMWLAQRLHRVDPQRGQFIPWTALHAQFGQGYRQLKFFRRDFKTTLNQVLTQYPEARVKTDRGGMLIANSPPPVPLRRVVLLPGASPQA